MTSPNDSGQINSFFDLLGRYKKATITLATAVLAWAAPVVAVGHVDGTAWVGLGIAVVGTGITAAVPNKQ